MKKICSIIILTVIFFTPIGCGTVSSSSSTTTTEQTFDDSATIDCIPGYTWSNSEDSCVLCSDAYIFGDDMYTTYRIQYQGDDYTVYRTYFFLGDDNETIVDMGDYDGYHYYFGSDTHYNYYLVEKDDVFKRLDEAIQSEWFSLEDMVTLFNISQLLSEEIS